MPYELVQLKGNSWYIPARTNVGLYRLNDRDVCLIDGGIDQDFAAEALTLIRARGWEVTKIVCTHAHADHVGGCAYFQRETGCSIYASEMELEMAKYPLFQPTVLCGCAPSGQLRGSYFMAEAFDLLPPDDPTFPDMFEIIPLPGHTLNQIGVCTPDGVLYAGDALAGFKMLEDYHITFLFDANKSLETVTMLEGYDAAFCVPSHAPATDDLAALSAANRAMITEIKSRILAYLAQPLSFDELLTLLFERYHTPVNLVQYTIVGQTVHGYLSSLHDEGMIEPVAVGTTLKWQLKG